MGIGIVSCMTLVLINSNFKSKEIKDVELDTLTYTFWQHQPSKGHMDIEVILTYIFRPYYMYIHDHASS